MVNAIGRPTWRVRRRIVISTLIFCAGETVYLTGWAADTELARTIANGVLILAGSVIGGYVFGAVWDDKNTMALAGRSRVRIDAQTDGPSLGGDDDNTPVKPGAE
jgi:hypothetical protein